MWFWSCGGSMDGISVSGLGVDLIDLEWEKNERCCEQEK